MCKSNGYLENLKAKIYGEHHKHWWKRKPQIFLYVFGCTNYKFSLNNEDKKGNYLKLRGS